MARNLATYAMEMTGAALAGYGAWLAWEPAGFLLAGVLLMGFSLGLKRGSPRASAGGSSRGGAS